MPAIILPQELRLRGVYETEILDVPPGSISLQAQADIFPDDLIDDNKQLGFYLFKSKDGGATWKTVATMTWDGQPTNAVQPVFNLDLIRTFIKDGQGNLVGLEGQKLKVVISVVSAECRVGFHLGVATDDPKLIADERQIASGVKTLREYIAETQVKEQQLAIKDQQVIDLTAEKAVTDQQVSDLTVELAAVKAELEERKKPIDTPPIEEPVVNP